MTDYLERWASLPEGWDDDDTPAPRLDHIEALRHLRARIHALYLPEPEPFITGDGEMGFRWQFPIGRADCCFLTDGHVVSYARIGNEKLHGIDIPYTSPADLDILLLSLATICQAIDKQ